SLLSLTGLNFGATVTARSAPVAIGNELYFTATDSSHGNQVWKTDGTVAGTVQVSDGHDVNGTNGGIFPADLTAVGNTLYFSAGHFPRVFNIWKDAPSAPASPSALNPGGGGIFPADLTAVGNMLYFVGHDPTDGEQVFESDGTAAGTKMVADIPG